MTGNTCLGNSTSGNAQQIDRIGVFNHTVQKKAKPILTSKRQLEQTISAKNYKFKIMTVKKVWIQDGCIASGKCAIICPEVFEMTDIAVVKEDADLVANEPGIREAADNCPVEVIKFEEEED